MRQRVIVGPVFCSPRIGLVNKRCAGTDRPQTYCYAFRVSQCAAALPANCRRHCCHSSHLSTASNTSSMQIETIKVMTMNSMLSCIRSSRFINHHNRLRRMPDSGTPCARRTSTQMSSRSWRCSCSLSCSDCSSTMSRGWHLLLYSIGRLSTNLMQPSSVVVYEARLPWVSSTLGFSSLAMFSPFLWLSAFNSIN